MLLNIQANLTALRLSLKHFSLLPSQNAMNDTMIYGGIMPVLSLLSGLLAFNIILQTDLVYP